MSTLPTNSTTKGEIHEKISSQYLLPLILVSLFLLLIGLANLYSAGGDSTHFNVQLKHTVLGLICFGIIGWFIPLRYINSYAYIIYGGTVILLLTVLVLGKIAGGSQRWIFIAGFGFQPSEIAKIALPIIVAKFFFNNRKAHAYRLRDLGWLVFYVTLVFGMIFQQPDLGTAGVCVLIVIIQLLFVPIDWRSLAIVFFSGIGMAIVGWNVFLHKYQKMRVLTLLDPQHDPTGAGYNSLQSLVAVGSGKLFGKGYLQGTQTQLQFLPARHTDFAFSVFAEEHGFWGCILVFLLFSALIYIALEIGRQSRDTFNSMLAVGIAAFFLLEFTINIAMVLGMFPVVGLPLPFFSKGGSSMLTVCISIGLLVCIDRDNRGAYQSHSLLRNG